MSIPNYFTPNNDGYNDFWKINGLTREFYKEAEIIIFDRYGKVIHIMDMRMNEIGWSGMSNDRILPAEDYWYRLVLTDLTNNVVVRRGHFSLKR
jgi:gliding motility-associated-like protein